MTTLTTLKTATTRRFEWQIKRKLRLRQVKQSASSDDKRAWAMFQQILATKAQKF
jgi:hypothetical protein